MKRVIRIILIGVAVVVLLVVGAIGASLAVLDDDDYRRLASYLVERETGRTMIVDGRFALYPSLHPSLVMSKVRIANPTWASTPDLAQIDHLELQIALAPLLSGTLAIERLIVNDATFALERSADGATNWDLGGSGDGPDLVPVFKTVRLRDVDWRYRDDASGETTALALARLTLEEADGAGRLDAQGVWDGQPITAGGTLGTFAEALHPSAPFPVDLSASLPGLDLSVQGTIAEPAAGLGLDLRVAGHSDDSGPFLDRLGTDIPLAGPLEAEASIRGDLDAVQVADLHLSAGGSSGADKAPALQASGTIAVVNAGGAPLLDGIALEVSGATSTAALAGWLGRPLPDLGPVGGRMTLSGTSEALSISGMQIEAGAAGGPTLGATGAIERIGLTPTFSVGGADLQLTAEAPDLAALSRTMDVSLPATSFSYSGRLSGDPNKWSLAGEGRLGDTAVTQSFAGSVASAPPRLSGELSLTVAGLELTGRGTMADPAGGQGLDLHLVGHADDVAPLLRLLGHRAAAGAGRLAAEATVSGDLEALEVSDLQLSLDHKGAGRGGAPALQVRGKLGAVRPGGAPLIQDIGVEVRTSTTAAALSSWLGRELPDLGPLDGRFTMSGTSNAVQVGGIELQAGTAERLAIDVSGGIEQIRLAPDAGFGGADLQIEAQAPDPSAVGAMLDFRLPITSTFSYRGRLKGDLDAWTISGKSQLGRSTIEEHLEGSFRGERPRISGQLSIPVLHLADLGLGSPDAPDPERSSSIEAAAMDWPSVVAALRGLGAADLDVDAEIGEVEGAKLAIGRGKIDLKVDDGVARIDPATFDIAEGSVLIHLTADGRSTPPQVDLSLHADDVQLGELLSAMGATAPITGELALILKLQSRGDSAHHALASLDGEADFAIQGGDVDFKNLNLATADLMTWLLAGADRSTGLLGGTTAGGRTKLECFVARFDVEHGIASAQSLLMKTRLTVSAAKGTIDLVNRTVDLHVHLKPREALFSSARTYRVRGPIADPKVDFSKVGFAAHAIEGLILTPLDALGSLFPLVDDGGRDKGNPCLH